MPYYYPNYLYSFLKGVIRRKASLYKGPETPIKHEPYNHIIICVHGVYQGEKLFLKINNKLAKPNRNLYNFEYPARHMNIQECAMELFVYILDVLRNLDYNTPYRLSLIGHSMGGIVISEALKHLQKYQIDFHDYITIATPFNGAKAARLVSHILPKYISGPAIRDIQGKNIPTVPPDLILGVFPNKGLNRSLLSKEIGDAIVTHKECIPELYKSITLIQNTGHSKILWEDDTIKVLQNLLDKEEKIYRTPHNIDMWKNISA